MLYPFDDLLLMESSIDSISNLHEITDGRNVSFSTHENPFVADFRGENDHPFFENDVINLTHQQDRGDWSLKEIMEFERSFCIEMTGAALVAIAEKCEQKDK